MTAHVLLKVITSESLLLEKLRYSRQSKYYAMQCLLMLTADLCKNYAGAVNGVPSACIVVIKYLKSRYLFETLSLKKAANLLLSSSEHCSSLFSHPRYLLRG